MPKRFKRPYQYKSGDNLPNLAKANGVTEQDILAANPGGYPFDVGQNINVPYVDPMTLDPSLGGAMATPVNTYNPAGTSGGRRYMSTPATMPSPGYQPFNVAPAPPSSTSSFQPTPQTVANRGPQYYKWADGTYHPTPQGANNAQRGRGFNSTYTSQPQTGWGGETVDLANYGEYLDTGGNVKQGTTPFGVDEYGRRLDVTGNVWEANTAKKDIYGGNFKQVGQKAWERDRRTGKLIRVMYTRGGKKVTIAGKRRRGGGRMSQLELAQRRAQSQAQEARDYSLANGLVSFGVGSG